MAGVTPNGIHYPDGASKAKNLGPELERMANDIDTYIGSYLIPTGPIRQIIIGVAEEIVPPIVQRELDEANVVRAYPEDPILRTTRSTVPMSWVAKTLLDPYDDTYADVYHGTWGNPVEVYGELPTLSSRGKLQASQIPDVFARTSDVDSRIAEVVAQIPETFQTERHISADLPIFAARLAASRQAGEPCAGVILGSSTSAEWPGYLQGLAPIIQSAYPVADPSTVQRSTSADFTPRTEPGFHLYSAAQGSTRSDTYLTDVEAQKIAALDPAFVLHMVVNDYTDQTDPAVYGANVLDRIEYLDTLLTKPTQHMLVFPYARMAFDAHTHHWDEYGAALEQIAGTRTDTVFVNLNDAYVAIGVTSTGADPLGFIRDTLHQTPAGYRFMVGLFADVFTA